MHFFVWRDPGACFRFTSAAISRSSKMRGQKVYARESIIGSIIEYRKLLKPIRMNSLKTFKAGFIWWGILFSFSCYGQLNLPHAQPLGAMPMQFNPSFAGEAGAGRFSSVATHSNLFTTKAARHPFSLNSFGFQNSYDRFFSALGAGIGIASGYEGIRISNTLEPVLPDTSSTMGNGNPLNSDQSIDNYFISLSIAPKILIKGKYTLSPSIEFSQGFALLDWVDPLYSPSIEPVKSLRYTSSRLGLLFNTKKFYIGYSIFLLNHYQYKTASSTFRSPRVGDNFAHHFLQGKRQYLKFGYTFQRSSESKFSFTPQLAFTFYERINLRSIFFNFPLINLTFRYEQYLAGVNNSGFHLGFQDERLRVMLSSGLGLYTRWGPYPAGNINGNLSFRYIFNNGDKGPDHIWF